MSHHTLIRNYLLGLACAIGGAGMTEWTGSWLPLALGASAALMSTFSTVRVLLKRR